MVSRLTPRSLTFDSRPDGPSSRPMIGIPNPAKSRLKTKRSFTLIELLVSITIVAVMAIIFGAMIGQMNLAWVTGQERMQNFQNGRAILEIMSRELAPAAISKGLQFVQNPATSGQKDLHKLLPFSSTPVITQATNSDGSPTDSLFWQRPFTPNGFGNIYETGYFLMTVAKTATTPAKYELARFNMAPNYVATSLTTQYKHGGATASANTSLYWIYDPPTAYASGLFPVTTPWPEYSDAPWLTLQNNIATANASAPSTLATTSPTQVVSDGVIGLWIRCLDKNGNPIPWLYQSSLYTFAVTPNLKFNSAAAFLPATLGVQNSFNYTAPPTSISTSGTTETGPTTTSTQAANRLPSAVELTIVTIDSQTLARNPTIPPIPPATGPTDVPNEIQVFMNSLLANNIKSAKVFSTTVRLQNGTD